MQPMQPACASLSFKPGDTFDLTIRLFSDGGGGARAPLTIAPGEVFALSLGRIVATTADAGAGRLLTIVDEDGTRLFRQFSALETRRFSAGHCSQPLTWSFARVPTPGIRRTYAEGAISLVSPTGCGVGDQIIDLTVMSGGITIEMGPIPDPASYTDAREAAIRQDQAIVDQMLKMRAYAAALLF